MEFVEMTYLNSKAITFLSFKSMAKILRLYTSWLERKPLTIELQPYLNSSCQISDKKLLTQDVRHFICATNVTEVKKVMLKSQKALDK